MFKVILTFCAIANPFQCVEVVNVIEERGGLPGQCSLRGQTEATEWLSLRRGYRFARYRCERVDMKAAAKR